jgi:hypothetical protein
MPSLSPLSTFSPCVRDHRLPERRVGGREHRREQRDLEDREPVEERPADGVAEGDGQGQAHQQEADGQCAHAAQHGNVRARGVREEHERQGQLGEEPHGLGVGFEREEPQSERADGEAEAGEDDGAADPASFHPARHRAVEQGEAGQQRERSVHGGTVYRTRSRVDTPSDGVPSRTG